MGICEHSVLQCLSHLTKLPSQWCKVGGDKKRKEPDLHKYWILRMYKPGEKENFEVRGV